MLIAKTIISTGCPRNPVGRILIGTNLKIRISTNKVVSVLHAGDRGLFNIASGR